MSTLLPAVTVTPGLFALVAALLVGRRYRWLGYAGASIAGLGFLIACLLAVFAARGIGVDRVAAVLLLLVFGVSTVVQAFAIRYLAGDPRAVRFTAGASLLTSASAGMVTATTLPGLAVGWTLVGVALCLLLGMYWHLPAARDGVRRTAIAFLIGDLALWVAVVIVTARWGVSDLRALAGESFTGPLVPIVGCLAVVAALSRSAQVPFHKWLPATLAAPTPVSALLHAGVVNAGGILLLRLAPLVSGDVARALTIVAGATTLVYGAVVMLVKPDIKGALANSTMAQMGFMILTCGLGLWAATIFHLVAHGFYKATLFLSSGSAVAARRRAVFNPLPPVMTGRRRLLNGVLAVILPGAALYAATLVIPLSADGQHAEQALLIFAWVTGAAATWGWLGHRSGPPGLVTVMAVLPPVAIAYLGLVYAATHYLAPALPAATPSALSWPILAALVTTLAAVAAVRWSPGTSLHRAIYARALSAGYISSSLPAQSRGARS
ncbi:proton-conducting transporter membrane subunit [Mycolicibacterium aichiense]|uniref:proton-conducting transporter transmembrane domain-containing protein n=1 Tax=Mycolicibacterium aichiense TaxID=1799 RepID=UPI0013D3343D|nr:proton-conducting transporter membrane subunit [Mycolicibacterium aichiense]MCV7018889.1 sodium:proton antiporter [Mycolicibacterium aichiense]